MKELSIEEKAKRYDEALERYKAKQEYESQKVHEFIEYLFPELKESEDERIKEKIIATIHLYYGEPLEDEAKEMIAWLENQGEQKPAWSEEDKKVIDNIEWALIDKNVKEKTPNRYRDEFAWLKSLKDRVQPKQEWSDEDEKMYATTIFALAGTMGNEDKLDWLKSLKDRVGCEANFTTTKEWSEDDETMIALLHNIISHQYSLDIIKKEEQLKLEDWLKSLKDKVQPQLKQEWSQNDIDMIDWLIRCCEKEHEELCNDKYGHQDIVSDLKRDCRKKWNWLESLKNKVVPQSRWKPSDEQIKVCKEVYADILSAKGFDLGTVNSELNRLEEELKKLK